MTVRRGISKRSHEKIGDCEQSTGYRMRVRVWRVVNKTLKFPIQLGPVNSKYTNGEIKHYICREGKAANRLSQNKIANKFVESIVKGNVKRNLRYVSLFIHSFTCLSIYVSKYLFIYLSIYLFIYLFISLYKTVTGMLVGKLKLNP